ncbi:NDR1/HIN1-like protein 26 [Ricinus communis]|uniref:Signal transducer, putative n=1 Tax=Ricinus communis TaxID=3988 RepID=B9RXS4_RICCO|nr:NDR1/HIN1-like protein 26 [Ricinus communis]EEF43930.1 signal transducer, putative [Ricinus communis]|eukprot:XP_002518543.1 NDR1/HIN1-like protein 26 [Ricinus communis]
MYTSDRLPVRQSGPSQNPNPTIKRHHTARYYAHRVHESLTTRVSKIICATFLILLFLVGLVLFILWLSLRPHRPRVFLTDFSIPGLGQPNGFENAQVIFNVTVRNSNQHIGFYYGKVVGSVYYKEMQVGYTQVLDQFYQEPKNTTALNGVLSGATLTVSSQRWMQFVNARAQGRVMFVLDISSDIRFKVSTWGSHHHRMHASCEAVVGSDGFILATYRNKKCPVYFT